MIETMTIEQVTANQAGLMAIGAGIAVGICGIAAGLAEGGIGSTTIDKGVMDKDFGKAIVMTTIGESQVIYGFVIAMIIISSVFLGGVL